MDQSWIHNEQAYVTLRAGGANPAAGHFDAPHFATSVPSLPAGLSGLQLKLRNGGAATPDASLTKASTYCRRSLTFSKDLPGGTPVHRIHELSAYFGVPRLMIKDESYNPCGTHKDRKSAYVVRRALSFPKPPGAFCLITAGSAALSLSHFAAWRALPVVAFVGCLAGKERRLIGSACLKTIKLDLEGRRWSREELQSLAGKSTGRDVLDVTNVAAPYGAIAREIATYEPDFVVLPVGGGELFVGLAEGLAAAGLRTRLIGVGVRRRDTAADKLYASYSPYRDVVNSLTAESSPHRLFYLDDESLLAETRAVLSKFMPCEPSSAVAFEALRFLKLKPGKSVMVINTGTFRRPRGTAGHTLPLFEPDIIKKSHDFRH
jgi:threonine dehydratase